MHQTPVAQVVLLDCCQLFYLLFFLLNFIIHFHCLLYFSCIIIFIIITITIFIAITIIISIPLFILIILIATIIATTLSASSPSNLFLRYTFASNSVQNSIRIKNVAYEDKGENNTTNNNMKNKKRIITEK